MKVGLITFVILLLTSSHKLKAQPLNEQQKSESLVRNMPELNIIASFIAQRVKSKVDLTWEMRSNNAFTGFEIQRKTGNGEWQHIANVFPDKEETGNVITLLYEYSDVNISKDNSEYRLRILDKNKKERYSNTAVINGYK